MTPTTKLTASTVGAIGAYLLLLKWPPPMPGGGKWPAWMIAAVTIGLWAYGNRVELGLVDP